MTSPLVLIIEDNPKNRKLFRDVLHFNGYRTLEADCAETGLALVREHRPALVLMDIQLPNMDGREAMTILKADPSTSAIPIIATTSLAMKGDRETLLQSGFDAYLAKPINIKELPGVIAQYIGSQSQHT